MASGTSQGKIQVDNEVSINLKRDVEKSPEVRSRFPDFRQKTSKSVHSSATAKSASQLIKDKLLEPNSYSTREVSLMIEKIGTGTDLKASKARSKTFTDNISVMKIIIPNSKDVTDRHKGKYITDCLVNMIVQGGEVLAGIIATNFDLTEETMDAQASVQKYEKERNKLTLESIDPAPVDKELYELKLLEAKESLKDELWHRYHEDFEERVTLEALSMLGSGASGRASRSLSPSGTPASRSASPSGASTRTPSTPAAFSVPTWENSDEETQYQIHLSSEIEVLVRKNRQAVIAASEKYQEAIEQRLASRIKLANVTTELEKAQALENRLLELSRQENQIVSVLKAALGTNHMGIVTRLNMDVVVNGSRISAPYVNNSLSGIFQNLYNEYNKKLFSFFSYLWSKFICIISPLILYHSTCFFFLISLQS